MVKFTVTHEIQCNEETFWKVFLDKTFNEALFKEGLQFPDYSITEQRETDTEVIRKVSAQPKMSLPGPVMKILGSGFRYTEEGKLNKATKRWTWTMRPSSLADKIRQEGNMRIEPLGDNRVRRIAEITMEAKIFGVGGLMESSAEKQLREGWDHSAVFMNKWLSDKKSAA